MGFLPVLVAVWMFASNAPTFITPTTQQTLRSSTSRIAMARDPASAEEWDVTRSSRFDDDSTKNPPGALYAGLFLIFFLTSSIFSTKLETRAEMEIFPAVSVVEFMAEMQRAGQKFGGVFDATKMVDVIKSFFRFACK